MVCCVHTGEAAVLFVQKWFMTGGPLGALFKIVILDILNAQTPELQPWFRETREAKFGVTLEEVRLPRLLPMPCMLSSLSDI